MVAFLRRLWSIDSLTYAGLFVTVLGHAVSLAETQPWYADLKLFGLALFATGVIVTLKQTTKGLTELSTAQESLSQQMNKKFVDVQESHDVLSEQMTNGLTELRTAQELMSHKSTIDDALHWAQQRSPRQWHIAAASNALHTMLTEYVPATTRRLREVMKGRGLSLDLRDHSPIHELMFELVDTIPNGSVWLGITHLEQRSAWELPKADDFNKFIARMRARVEEKEIRVLRLYSFHSHDARVELHDLMYEEEGFGLNVRFLEGAQPPDISLIWIPQRHGWLSGTVAADAAGVLSAVRTKEYQPACALAYATRGGLVLTELSMCPGDSPRFGSLERAFRRWWSKAQELPSLQRRSA